MLEFFNDFVQLDILSEARKNFRFRVSAKNNKFTRNCESKTKDYRFKPFITRK
ncbi:TPA: hypothetical protein RTH01_000868 [Campylobacter jejuni]|nr:hypothetical protein [Campylobacter jejuni]HDZ5084057.1 hypothetical protein [Campylobacter jejuni]HDZ5097401.1 hypothetical protein [Campylobacter jejuni]